jgi:hypothetical protein
MTLRVKHRGVALAAAGAILAALLPTASAFAAITPAVITPATGGTGILTTTAATGGSGAYTNLTGPSITESVGLQLANATLALSAPAGFEFNPSITTPPVLSGTGCAYTASALVYFGTGNSSATLQTTLGGTTGTGACTITFTGLQIRPQTTTPASGNIALAISGSDAGGAGAVSSVAPPAGPLTLTTYSPTMNNNAIIWGQSYVDLITTGAAGTVFQIEASTDEQVWTPLKDSSAVVLNFTIASNGSKTYRYTPIRNYWYRSVAGSTKSNTPRVTVRQTVSISPSHSSTVTVAAGSKITFTTTSRPARSDLPTANVMFQMYQKSSSGSWVLHTQLTKAIDSNGNVIWPVTFSTKGSFYVRAQTQPTSVNSNSFWTPNQYYTVQ